MNLSAESKHGILVGVFGILLALSQTACTTMRSAGQAPDEVASRVEVGDQVRVWTKDDRMREFEVTRLTENSISGPVEEISFDEIIRVDVEEIDGWRTAEMTTLSVLSVAMVIGFIILLSFASF